MENQDRPPLGAEVYERIEAALYSVQMRYGAMLKLFAEDLPGASPIARVLGGYENVPQPKLPIALCNHLRGYAVELFETEARIYPQGDSLPAWLESLARRVEQRIIDHVLSMRTSGMSAFSVGLTHHASERQMREAIHAALQTRAHEKLQVLSKSEESPASAASEFAPVGGAKPEQNHSLPSPKEARMPATIYSATAPRRLESFLSTKGIGLAEFAVQLGITDRTLREFRRTGKIRRETFDKIAAEMGMNREQLMDPNG